MYSQGISQFYLHTHTFIRNRNEPYLPTPKFMGRGLFGHQTVWTLLHLALIRFQLWQVTQKALSAKRLQILFNESIQRAQTSAKAAVTLKPRCCNSVIMPTHIFM